MKISTAHMTFQPCLAVSLLFFSMQLHAQTFNTVEQCEIALKQQNDRYKEVYERTVKCQREIDPLNSACLTLSKESDWNLKRASEIRSQCYVLRDALRKANSSSSSSTSNSRHSNTNSSNSRTDSSYSAAEAERQRAARYWEQRAAQERQQEQRNAAERDRQFNNTLNSLNKSNADYFERERLRRESEKQEIERDAEQKKQEAERTALDRENAFRKVLADNQAISADFVKKFRHEPGVVTLPSGTMYRIAKVGAGPKPTTNSEVHIAFRSLLSAIGVPLSGTQVPPPFKVFNSPIPALKETLPLMGEGSVWEVVIPPENNTFSGQFTGQAITIQVELGEVK